MAKVLEPAGWVSPELTQPQEIDPALGPFVGLQEHGAWLGGRALLLGGAGCFRPVPTAGPPVQGGHGWQGLWIRSPTPRTHTFDRTMVSGGNTDFCPPAVAQLTGTAPFSSFSFWDRAFLFALGSQEWVRGSKNLCLMRPKKPRFHYICKDLKTELHFRCIFPLVFGADALWGRRFLNLHRLNG